MGREIESESESGRGKRESNREAEIEVWTYMCLDLYRTFRIPFELLSARSRGV